MKWIFSLILLFNLCFAFAELPIHPDASQCVTWPVVDFQPIANSKTHQIAPDYGIYWFKVENGKEAVAKAFTSPALQAQFADGHLNQLPPHETEGMAKNTNLKTLEQSGFFDPNKPTLLFIHGVQIGATVKRSRFDFCYQFPTKDGGYSKVFDALPFWHDYNVAIFYWNQFADEMPGKNQAFSTIAAIVNPETRIYNGHSKAGMDWVYLDKDGKLARCTHSDAHCISLPKDKKGNTKSVSEIAFQAYQDAFPETYHQSIHLAGFSLGNQVAILLAKQISLHPHLPQLSQLILLDPYYTPNYYKINIGNQKVAIAPYDADLVKELIAVHSRLGVVFYRSSKASEGLIGDDNMPLQHVSAVVKISPLYLSHIPEKNRLFYAHLAGVYSYLYSKKFPDSQNSPSAVLQSQIMPNANSSDETVSALMGQERNCVLKTFGERCG